MKKNTEAIKAALAEPAEPFGFNHLMAKRVRDMRDHDYTLRPGPLPDRRYFKYYLKIIFDQRYWIDARPWDAGHTYEFADGGVEIWCGPEHDGSGLYRVYEYPSMGDTGDWMLD